MGKCEVKGKVGQRWEEDETIERIKGSSIFLYPLAEMLKGPRNGFLDS